MQSECDSDKFYSVWNILFGQLSIFKKMQAPHPYPLLTQEELELTPSRKDGIDKEKETLARIYACEFVQHCGILLKLYVFRSFEPKHIWFFHFKNTDHK